MNTGEVRELLTLFGLHYAQQGLQFYIQDKDVPAHIISTLQGRGVGLALVNGTLVAF